jgi:hypothetical protein
VPVGEVAAVAEQGALTTINVSQNFLAKRMLTDAVIVQLRGG